MTQKNRSRILITAILVGVLAVFFVKAVFFKKSPTEIMLIDIADQINKSAPIQLDRGTQLDKAIPLSNNTIQYNYTLLATSITDSFDVEEKRSELEPGLINYMKKNPEMEDFRKQDVTIIYSYNDAEGNFLFQVIIGPEVYKGEIDLEEGSE